MQHKLDADYHKTSKRNEQILYSVPEACEVLSVSRAKLYDLVSCGRIKVVKLDKSRPRSGVRFRPQDLVAFADENAQFYNL